MYDDFSHRPCHISRIMTSTVGPGVGLPHDLFFIIWYSFGSIATVPYPVQLLKCLITGTVSERNHRGSVRYSLSKT